MGSVSAVRECPQSFPLSLQGYVLQPTNTLFPSLAQPSIHPFFLSLPSCMLPIPFSNPFGLLQDWLARIFYSYGLLVSRHPTPFICFPLVLTFLLSFGVLNMRVEDDLRFLYSPAQARSRIEYNVHRQFSGDSLNNSFVSITLEALDGGNIFTKEDRGNGDTLKKLNHYILEKMDVQIDGETINFGKEICSKSKTCELSNTIAMLFLDAFWSDKLRADPRIRIEYPTMQFFENRLFLPTHFYGVSLANETDIEAFEMVHFIYQVPAYKHHISEKVSVAFEKAVRSVLDSDRCPFKSSIFSLSILKDEMGKNVTYTVPFISLTVLLLISFTVGSCMTSDWITSKPIEAIIGVFVSTLAIVSSAGLLFALGIPFVNQVSVMPFIALAIGVDDVYVMLGAWQDTSRLLPPHKRMALSLEEAGSAISVTSLTSVLSFGIGTFSSTPAISIFCKFVAVAIAFDWFYQLTFFSAVMVLGGRREAAGYHSIFVWRKCDADTIAKAKNANAVSPTRYFFSRIFAPLICHPVARIILLLTYVVYILLSFYGCSLLEPNLTPSRLVVDNSPLLHYLHLAESKIWAEGLIGRVYVNNAPDFSTHPDQVERIGRMVSELESTPYSMGPNSTSLWLNDFNKYRQFFSEGDEKFYKTLKSFLEISFNNHWETGLRWSINTQNRSYVSRFVFTTAFKIESWNMRTELLLHWRNITDRYPEFEALVFDENNFYSDQMLELQATILQSLGTAILTLITVCVLFVAESRIVFWVVFTLISMDIGTAGFLSLWGADLDPTTVVNILMSIGQCIDFATHIGYRIYRSPCVDPDERIADSLGAIGWPVMQAGTSTLLAIIVMLLVPSNAVRMFARTSVLVVATGLFHGLLVLPIIIRSFASHARVHKPHSND